LGIALTRISDTLGFEAFANVIVVEIAARLPDSTAVYVFTFFANT
jgi:hypothetical protein